MFLQSANPSIIKAQVQELSEQFQAAMIGYDEGLLSDDKTLAGAVWRTFLQQDCNEPENVERLVHYIRKQVQEAMHQSSLSFQFQLLIYVLDQGYNKV
jgi:cytochrome b pre-mRNA-processing protein 3